MAVTSNEFKQFLIDGLKLADISVDDINDSDALFGDDDLGLDSVDSIELVLIIEKEYGIKISNTEQYQEIFKSVNSLLKYINENN